MNQANGEIVNVVLWGASQAGKTTVLATYFCNLECQPKWLDVGAQETVSTLVKLAPIWNALQRNELPPTTLVAEEFYLVRHRDGRLIRFRDMRGGNTENPANNMADVEALRKADALILFVEWPSRTAVLNVIAVGNARLFSGNCPKALAVTKVESFLTPEKLVRFSLSPLAVAEEMSLDRDFVQILKSVPAADIAPVTVYGYLEDGYPAHYRDEFGRFVPYKVGPRNVALPFERALGNLI